MSLRIKTKSIFLNLVVLALSFTALAAGNSAVAAGGNKECPVGLVKSLSLDDGFGPGPSGLTRRLEHRHNVKVVM